MKKHESVRLFKSPFCEWFSHVHPITPLVLWVPVIGYLVWRSYEVHGINAYSVGSIAASGFFIWTLTEYLLHRFVFHMRPDNYLGQRLQYIVHGLHHDDPVDPTRLVMPPFVGVCLAIILYSTFRIFLGRIWVDPFFAGFLVGYLCYDYIHFGVHHFTPRTRIGKYLKQSHMIHHYANSESRWGVSSPLWDYVFGTLEEPKSIRHGS